MQNLWFNWEYLNFSWFLLEFVFLSFVTLDLYNLVQMNFNGKMQYVVKSILKIYLPKFYYEEPCNLINIRY